MESSFERRFFDPSNTADVEVVRFYSHFLGAAMSKTKQVGRNQLRALPGGWRCWDGIKSADVEIRQSDTKMVKQVKFLRFSINQLARP